MAMRRTVSNKNRHDFEAGVTRVPYGTGGEPLDDVGSQFGPKPSKSKKAR